MSHNTALVGTAHIHTPNFVKRLQTRQDVKVSYVWDHDIPRAEKNAEALGAKVSDLRSIWQDETVASVIICSETHLHKDLVLAACQAKKHLFVEKPLGFKAEEALAMAKAVEAADLTFQTGYFNRSSPIYQFLKQHIEQGTFGKITRARHMNCHQGALAGWFDTDWRWMTDPKQAGVGAFGDLGAHSLDLLIWFFGPVAKVVGHVDTAINRYSCDEYGEALIQFDNGVLASLAAGWVDLANPVSFMLSGTEGHAYVMGRDKLFIKCPKLTGTEEEVLWQDLPQELPHAFELFFDALVKPSTKVPLISVGEAAYSSAVMERIYQSVEVGGWR
ncbi:MAG: Gfo/Idh/MocA family oxidoreductase [Deinococcales bacterium]